MYETYSFNEHHFKPFYFNEYILPEINNILEIGYNINDFEYIEKDDNGHDVSYLMPKCEYKFDLYGLSNNDVRLNVDFNELRCCNLTSFDITSYHKLFAFPHMCSKIINKSIDNNRVLVLSCDSQMIPIIPVLACYFKEIWALDNRSRQEFIKDINIDEVTDVLIAGGFNTEGKYLNDNFK